MSDSYKKEIEDKKISEENLLGEVGKLNMCENWYIKNSVY